MSDSNDENKNGMLNNENEDLSQTAILWSYIAAETLNDYIDEYNDTVDILLTCDEEKIKEAFKVMTSFHEQGKEILKDLKKIAKGEL